MKIRGFCCVKKRSREWGRNMLVENQWVETTWNPPTREWYENKENYIMGKPSKAKEMHDHHK